MPSGKLPAMYVQFNPIIGLSLSALPTGQAGEKGRHHALYY